jgi:hypothetical protein
MTGLTIAQIEQTVISVKKERRGRKPKPGSVKEYFKEETEKAIVLYNSPDVSTDEKNIIFERYIHKPLKKLVYYTARSYPLYYDIRYTVEDMENDLYHFVFINLFRFNPDNINAKGEKSKAFSYFSTMCKHEAKRISKKTYEFDKASDDVVENMDVIERDINISYRINEELIEDKESIFIKEVFLKLCNKIRDKINTDTSIKDIDIKVGNSLIVILENFSYYSEPSESKNSLFFINNRVVDMIMELTNNEYKKSDIKKSIKNFKSVYKELLNDFSEDY